MSAEAEACPTPRRKRFATEATARQEAERRAAATGRDPKSAHPCRCRGWHLGTWRSGDGSRAACENPGKIAFATEETARAQARALMALRGDPLYVYGDCDCGWWHLTSKFHAE